MTAFPDVRHFPGRRRDYDLSHGPPFPSSPLPISQRLTLLVLVPNLRLELFGVLDPWLTSHSATLLLCSNNSSVLYRPDETAAQSRHLVPG